MISLGYSVGKPTFMCFNPNKDIIMTENKNPLIPLPKFKNSDRCPVEPYHLIFKYKQSLVEFGAIVPYGSRWLVDEAKFHDWFRANANQNNKGGDNV